MNHLVSAAIPKHVPTQVAYPPQLDSASMTSSNKSSGRSGKLSIVSSKRSQYTQPRLSPALANVNESLNLQRIDSNQSQQSIQSNLTYRPNLAGNFTLNRVHSTVSLESAFSTQSRYRVTLELSPKEISLLRYMWNRMLCEELDLGVVSKPVKHMPGSLFTQAQTTSTSKQSSRQVLEASSTFCSQLYSNLLAMDSSLETSFPSLRHQAISMASVLSLAVNSLESLKSLESYLIELAKRHSRIFGIEPAQFELMGEAFIMTFHERFGNRFTHDLQLIWIKFYMYLANSLLQFGLDPIMKIASDTHDFDAASNTSIHTKEGGPDLTISTKFDSESIPPSACKSVSNTDFSSHTSSAKPQQNLVRKCGSTSAKNSDGQATLCSGILRSVTPGNPEAVPLSPAGHTKKKKSRLGLKKGDCSVM